jgi:hypothetical protein
VSIIILSVSSLVLTASIFVPDKIEIEVLNDKEVICHLNGDCESTENPLATTQQSFVQTTEITTTASAAIEKTITQTLSEKSILIICGFGTGSLFAVCLLIWAIYNRYSKVTH